MKLEKLRQELRALVAKIEGRGSDADRLRALDRVFEIRNQCSTRSELRAFCDVIPQKKIPLLAKLAVDRSGKGQKSGTVALSPSAERLLGELAAWAKEYDPQVDATMARIRRGDEKTISQFCDAIIPHLKDLHPIWVRKLKFGLSYGGRLRLSTLAEIITEKLGTAKAQDIARMLLHETRCPECSKEQKKVRCGCGCRRTLCAGCADIDSVTQMILRELAVNC